MVCETLTIVYGCYDELPMKLLVVEDETKIGEYLRQGLMEAGFMVSLARNGLDGHHQAMTETFDLVILDVMLPDIDGWRILKSLREAGKNVPVMFLTARDSVNDRVKGLELGADDYLTNITVDPIFRHNCGNCPSRFWLDRRAIDRTSL